ncbi:MAG: GYD domain-containing protein [Actinobacteria bacterium]|nr:MAG: GYD domain-containing protein [Actinomycetota bacterium]
MPRYLIEASYSAEGVRGVAQKGGTARREAVEQLIGSIGGTLETFYFAFGDADALVICELPSEEVAAALAMSINQSGATKVRTVVLLTPQQVDAAAKAVPQYRPPGG